MSHSVDQRESHDERPQNKINERRARARKLLPLTEEEQAEALVALPFKDAEPMSQVLFHDRRPAPCLLKGNK